MWVPIAVSRLSELLYPCYFTLLTVLTYSAIATNNSILFGVQSFTNPNYLGDPLLLCGLIWDTESLQPVFQHCLSTANQHMEHTATATAAFYVDQGLRNSLSVHFVSLSVPSIGSSSCSQKVCCWAPWWHLQQISIDSCTCCTQQQMPVVPLWEPRKEVQHRLAIVALICGESMCTWKPGRRVFCRDIQWSQ